MFHVLSSGLHVCAVWHRDSAHRVWNDAKLALQRTALWTSVLEMLQIMQTPHGPWSSEQWFRHLRELCDRHVKQSNSGDPLFRALLERIRRDYKDRLTEEEGSAAEVEELWRLLCES
eukprot:5930437-Amphidinium_carterae.2